MPKKAAELTAKKVESIKAPGMHAVGGVPGLYLQVTAGQGRSWVYRYKLGERRRDMGLGPHDRLSLAEARQKARAARHGGRAGKDPIDARGRGANAGGSTPPRR